MTSIRDILASMGYQGVQNQMPPLQPKPVDGSKPPKNLSKTQQYLWELGYRGIKP